MDYRTNSVSTGQSRAFSVCQNCHSVPTIIKGQKLTAFVHMSGIIAKKEKPESFFKCTDKKGILEQHVGRQTLS